MLVCMCVFVYVCVCLCVFVYVCLLACMSVYVCEHILSYSVYAVFGQVTQCSSIWLQQLHYMASSKSFNCVTSACH